MKPTGNPMNRILFTSWLLCLAAGFIAGACVANKWTRHVYASHAQPASQPTGKVQMPDVDMPSANK